MVVVYIALFFIFAGIIFLVMSTKAEKKVVSKDEAKKLFTREGHSAADSHALKASSDRKADPEVVGRPRDAEGVSFGKEEYYFYETQHQAGQQMASSQAVEMPQSSVEAPSSYVKPEAETAIGVVVQTNEETFLFEEEVVGADQDAPDLAKHEAVLFEDRDKVVVFFEEEEQVRVDRYNNLRRVGGGTLQVGEDSLIFRFEKKLYRFDYYRIKEMRGNGEALLYYPDNISYPLLLVSPGKDDFSSVIIDSYNKYKHARV